MQASQAEPIQEHAKKSLTEKIMEELRQFAVMFVYLWVLLGLFMLNQAMILRQYGISFAPFSVTLINALVLAKVMVLVEHFDFSRWLRNRPLIYAVLFDSLLLTLLFIVFHILEDTVMGMIGGEPLRAAVPLIGGGGLFGLMSVSCILFFSLIPFFAIRNMSKVIGAKLMMALFFGTSPK